MSKICQDEFVASLSTSRSALLTMDIWDDRKRFAHHGVHRLDRDVKYSQVQVRARAKENLFILLEDFAAVSELLEPAVEADEPTKK